MAPIADSTADLDAKARRARAREILARLSLWSACGQSVAVGRQAKAILKPHLDLVLVLAEAMGKVRLRR